MAVVAQFDNFCLQTTKNIATPAQVEEGEGELVGNQRGSAKKKSWWGGVVSSFTWVGQCLGGMWGGLKAIGKTRLY